MHRGQTQLYVQFMVSPIAYVVNVLICVDGCCTTSWHQDMTLQLWRNAEKLDTQPA